VPQCPCFFKSNAFDVDGNPAAETKVPRGDLKRMKVELATIEVGRYKNPE
jgi:hypothetical protein